MDTLASIRDARDDAHLVQAAAAGDRRALESLLSRHYDRVHALCRRMLGNDADAADAAQEAMIAIARGLARFSGQSAFSTWAYRVTTNACLDEIRRRRRRPVAGLGAPGFDDEDDLRDVPADTGGGGDPVASGVADRLDVDAALQRIPPEFRAAVVLRDLCGFDYAEIAEMLEIPPGTVRSRIARGRAALVPLLAGNHDAPPERQTPRS